MEQLELIRYTDAAIPRKRKAEAQAPRIDTEESLILHLGDDEEDESSDEEENPMTETLAEADLLSDSGSDNEPEEPDEPGPDDEHAQG